jgi:hypothetical protein
VIELGRQAAHHVPHPAGSPTTDVSVGGGGAAGEVLLRDENQKEVCRISAATGAIHAGGNDRSASLLLRDGSGKDAISLEAKDRSVTIQDASGKAILAISPTTVNGTTGLMIGVYKPSGGTPGWVAIRDQGGNDSIYLDGKDALISVRDANGKEMLGFNPSAVKGTAGLMVGAYGPGSGRPGWIAIRDANGKDSVYLDGDKGQISLRDQSGNDSIRVDGESGDIVLQNADCAEEFERAPGVTVPAGSVVVINEEGRLEASRLPYDRTVAGVVSGAGECRPALLLDKKPGHQERLPVALVGRVYCRVDARHAAIQVGDLLTTSSTLGHAMKATDPTRAFGSVLGKALRPLVTGTGLIPVLVALQ